MTFAGGVLACSLLLLQCSDDTVEELFLGHSSTRKQEKSTTLNLGKVEEEERNGARALPARATEIFLKTTKNRIDPRLLTYIHVHNSLLAAENTRPADFARRRRRIPGIRVYPGTLLGSYLTYCSSVILIVRQLQRHRSLCCPNQPTLFSSNFIQVQ